MGSFNGVQSPRRGHTINQLRRLREDHWHNPDTGTQLAEEESQDHLHKMEQNQADKLTAKHINKTLKQKVRSRNRPYLSGDIEFRMINGHRVPFRKKAEPWL